MSKRVSRKPTPEGCRHVAWGFSPRNKAPQPTQSPKGAQAARSDPLAAYAPSGLDDFLGLPYLGLKPQALCLRPCGAGFRDTLLQPPDLPSRA